MNDPGLDGPINNAASEASNALSKKPRRGIDSKAFNLRDRTRSLISPTRWWYASTAFPLIAGTFGPMANAFSVCALVENWRVGIPPGGTEEHGIDIKDPRFLIAVNAVSLACALIANLSLLLNMAKRLSFEIAQPITIIGFFVASLLLIALEIYAGTRSFKSPDFEHQALTQAFYYGIFASGIYQIISYLMCVTVWGAYRGSYSKDFDLTVAQRTLMLQTISYLIYLLMGAFIYSKIEKWKFLDSVYWAAFTLLTVGIGDYAPKTHLGRSLLFPYAVGGIITVGLVVSSIRSLVLDRGAEKMSARVKEKTRARVVRQIALAEQGKGNSRKPIFGVSRKTARDLAKEPETDDVNELRRRKEEFETMRQVQEMAARERRYVALLFSTAAFAILWFIGALVFWQTESGQDWSYFDALYFSYTAILTIGYGDLYPMSNSGKPFYVFWSLLAVPTLTILVSNMGDTVVKGVKDVTIWLGEVSFLPSTEVRTRDRLKHGLYWMTSGFVSSPKAVSDPEKEFDREQLEEEWAHFRVLHPGLIQVFDASDRNKLEYDDVRTLDGLANMWAEAEEEDEKLAALHHDTLAQAEHHYRRLLISQIDRLYADTKMSPPKQYSYIEWTFYLRLLGENEGDGSRHGRAMPKHPIHPPHQKKKKKHHDSGSDEAGAKDGEQVPLKAVGDSDQPKWSWIGQMSPLMQDQNEAEWILERLFQKLESSLKDPNYLTVPNLDRVEDVDDPSDGSQQ